MLYNNYVTVSMVVLSQSIIWSDLWLEVQKYQWHLTLIDIKIIMNLIRHIIE